MVFAPKISPLLYIFIFILLREHMVVNQFRRDPRKITPHMLFWELLQLYITQARQ
jgi:hypothetical protein